MPPVNDALEIHLHCMWWNSVCLVFNLTPPISAAFFVAQDTMLYFQQIKYPYLRVSKVMLDWNYEYNHNQNNNKMTNVWCVCDDYYL
jgi:hypothetical protein